MSATTNPSQYIIDSPVGFIQWTEGGPTTTTTLPELATKFSADECAEVMARIPSFDLSRKLYDPLTKTAH